MIASALGNGSDGRVRTGGARSMNGVSRAVLFLEAICFSAWFAQHLFFGQQSVYDSVANQQRELEAPECFHQGPSNDTLSSETAASRIMTEQQQEEENLTTISPTISPTGSPTAAPSKAPQPQPKQLQSTASHKNNSFSGLKERPRLFWCGYEDMGNIAAATIFSDYNYPGSYIYRCVGKKRTITPQPYDVMVYGMHGPCGDGFRENTPALLQSFPGKILFINGESFGNVQTMSPTSSERLYQIGPYIAQQPWQRNSLQIYFLALRFFKLSRAQQLSIYYHRFKPHGNETKLYPNTVAYFTSNCVDFRQQAAAEIAEILPLHYTKGCRVGEEETNSTTTKAELVPKPSITSSGKRGAFTNFELYQHYKYCLVMENKAYPGYITEKILNAYLGGCVPIYYGTEEIFDIFNKDSFVFYNISNPKPALEQLQRLQENDEEYKEMLYDAHILKSREVMRTHFSLTDKVGGGRLKRRIREMMGLEGTWVADSKDTE